MALLKALCWALILINFTNICLVRSSSYQINTLAKIGGLKSYCACIAKAICLSILDKHGQLNLEKMTSCVFVYQLKYNFQREITLKTFSLDINECD